MIHLRYTMKNSAYLVFRDSLASTWLILGLSRPLPQKTQCPTLLPGQDKVYPLTCATPGQKASNQGRRAMFLGRLPGKVYKPIKAHCRDRPMLQIPMKKCPVKGPGSFHHLYACSPVWRYPADTCLKVTRTPHEAFPARKASLNGVSTQ